MKKLFYNLVDWFLTLWNHRKIIKRMQETLLKPLEIQVEELWAKPTDLEARIKSPILAHFVGWLISILKDTPGAENYVTLTFMLDYPTGPREYEVTVRYKDKLSPSNKNDILEKDNAVLKEQIMMLEADKVERLEIIKYVNDLLLFADSQNEIANGFRTQDSVKKLKELTKNLKIYPDHES